MLHPDRLVDVNGGCVVAADEQADGWYAGEQRTAEIAQSALRVPAAATLRASRRNVRNGQGVVFSGRLRGLPLPRAGKLVVVQAFYRRAWRTFAVTRADARGRFRQSYRFQATVGRVAYRFRAVIEREASYPYEAGVSPVVTVVAPWSSR